MPLIAGTLLLRNALLADGRSGDILMTGDRFADIGNLEEAAAERTIDLAGDLVLPGLVNGHVHLDKTLMGLPWRGHEAQGSVFGRIENEKRLRGGLALPVAQRARALLRRMVACGTVLARTHVDVDPDIGLLHIHQVREVLDEFAGLIDVQVVAFPQSGILGAPGTAKLLDAALAEGANLIGGLDPAAKDGDAIRHLDIVFGLAEKHRASVDIHLHDGGQLGAHELELVAERTLALGMAGRVTVSHAYCLAEIDQVTFGRVVDRLASAGVAIFTSAPGSAPMPPIRLLRNAGVRVFAGSDNIRDLWYPYSVIDPLEVAMLAGYRSDFRTDDDLNVALSLVTTEAAVAMEYKYDGIVPGGRADLIVLSATNGPEAVVERPPRKLVVKSGRIVADWRHGTALTLPPVALTGSQWTV